MPNPNRPENVTSIVWPSRSVTAVGATVAVLMADPPYWRPVGTAPSIRHVGVTTRYIDTNTRRRAAERFLHVNRARCRSEVLWWRSMTLHLHRAERTDLLADGLGALLA